MTYTSICWDCRNEFNHEHNIRVRTYCDDCKKEVKTRNQKRMDEYLKLKTEVMFDRALRVMEDQSKVNINDYLEEADVVLGFALSDFSKFASSDEMIVAMELLKNRIHMKKEFKILRYRVDFLLPDYKVALEVDGKLHDFKIEKDSARDIKILNELNKNDTGWEIIRIPTKYIRENIPQLIPAIEALIKERRITRKQHGGFLPSYYSRTAMYENKRAAKIAGDKDVHSYFKEKLENELKPEEL